MQQQNSASTNRNSKHRIMYYEYDYNLAVAILERRKFY